MKAFAYLIGIAVMVLSCGVGLQFLLHVQNNRHLDYFHNGTLFQALCSLCLGYILIVLAAMLASPESRNRIEK